MTFWIIVHHVHRVNPSLISLITPSLPQTRGRPQSISWTRSRLTLMHSFIWVVGLYYHILYTGAAALYKSRTETFAIPLLTAEIIRHRCSGAFNWECHFVNAYNTCLSRKKTQGDYATHTEYNNWRVTQSSSGQTHLLLLCLHTHFIPLLTDIINVVEAFPNISSKVWVLTYCILEDGFI